MQQRTSEQRRRALRVTRNVAAGAFAVELAASAAFAFEPRSVVVAMLATATLAGTAFVAAFEGFDERLRRGP